MPITRKKNLGNPFSGSLWIRFRSKCWSMSEDFVQTFLSLPTIWILFELFLERKSEVVWVLQTWELTFEGYFVPLNLLVFLCSSRIFPAFVPRFVNNSYMYLYHYPLHACDFRFHIALYLTVVCSRRRA